MSNELLVEKIQLVVSNVAEKLGQGFEYAWPELIKYVVWSHVSYLIAWGLVLMVGSILLMVGTKKHSPGNEDFGGFLAVVGGGSITLATIALTICTAKYIPIIVSPVGYIIHEAIIGVK